MRDRRLYSAANLAHEAPVLAGKRNVERVVPFVFGGGGGLLACVSSRVGRARAMWW